MTGDDEARGRARLTPIGAIRVVDDGPLVVRGPIRLVDETGREIPIRRRVNALCRCGRSSIQPFCDSTHRKVPFSPRAASGHDAGAPGSATPTDG